MYQLANAFFDYYKGDEVVINSANNTYSITQSDDMISNDIGQNLVSVQTHRPCLSDYAYELITAGIKLNSLNCIRVLWGLAKLL